MWNTIKPVLKALFGSKKFIVMLAGVLVWLAGKGGLALTDADVTPVLLLVGGYLASQGAADWGKESTKAAVAGLGKSDQPAESPK